MKQKLSKEVRQAWKAAEKRVKQAVLKRMVELSKDEKLRARMEKDIAKSYAKR